MRKAVSSAISLPCAGYLEKRLPNHLLPKIVTKPCLLILLHPSCCFGLALAPILHVQAMLQGELCEFRKVGEFVQRYYL